MAATDNITQARLKELLHYDPDTGLFAWIAKSSPYSHIKIGDVAGCQRPDGYIEIKIDGVSYRAHRLIFLYQLGYMPDQVDHDNQIRHDNRWVNLNPATNAINSKNQKLFSTNTSGACGVYRGKHDKKWYSQITIDWETIHLGRFTHKADAIAARKAAEIKYGFHENHGS